MSKIFSRKEIAEMVYSDYPKESEEDLRLFKRIVLKMLKWDEQVFIEYINGLFWIQIEKVRKNQYFLSLKHC